MLVSRSQDLIFDRIVTKFHNLKKLPSLDVVLTKIGETIYGYQVPYAYNLQFEPVRAFVKKRS